MRGTALHRRRERHLEAQRALDRRRRREPGEAARRGVDHVDAQRLQLLRVGHRVVDIPAAAAVDRRDADEHRLVLGPVLAHGFGRGERELHAAGTVAAVLVVALVAERRQELRQQVAVRAVDLDDVVARGIGAARGLAELLHDRVHLGDVERQRRRRVALPGGQRRRSIDLPALPACALRPELVRLVELARRRRLAAGMGDLGGGERAFLLAGSASAACGPRSGRRATCRDRPASRGLPARRHSFR